MSGFSSVAVLICYVSAAAMMLSLFIPQKRTRKILSFVLGLFILVAVGNGIRGLSFELPALSVVASDQQPILYNEEYEKVIIQKTADRLVLSIDSLLKDEGIVAEDIRLSLKKSADNSISADRVVIYISDAYRDRVEEIERIVVGNLSKEPEVYVTSSEAR